MAQPQQHIVDRADEIALLASPARIEIMDTLEAFGSTVSVAELARALGRSADGLYYHLRQLADGGLIEEELGDDGRRYRTRTRPGKRLTLRYKPGKTNNARAVRSVAASMSRVAERDFARALDDANTVVEGSLRELWAARSKGWVGTDELAEINRLLNRLMELLLQPRAPHKQKLIALSWVLAPLDARPARRAANVVERAYGAFRRLRNALRAWHALNSGRFQGVAHAEDCKKIQQPRQGHAGAGRSRRTHTARMGG